MARVVVFNAHRDTVFMLQEALELAGFAVIDGPLKEFDQGTEAALAFLRTHDPDAVVYDISPPYEKTAAFCADVQEADPGRGWVITSTNPQRTMRDLRGRPEAYEVIGKPYDLDRVVDAVRRAARRTENSG
jgi:DNA-binding NtrC family response regulator